MLMWCTERSWGKFMDNDVFFVNTTKDILFFVYDDRGCEVIARIAEKLRPLYEKHYDWVDEVDREKIEKRF